MQEFGLTYNPRPNCPAIRFNGFTEPWEEIRLTEKVQLFGGLTYAPSDVELGGTLVLRSSNVHDGEIELSDNVYVRNEAVNVSNVNIGDIIVVVRNGSRALIGKHAQIKKDMPNTVIGAFMAGMRYKIPKFLNATLNTPHFDYEISRNLGATINQITTGNFNEMKFMFPCEDEQRKIGDFFYNFDELISSKQLEIDKHKTIKQSLFGRMFVN